jgi:filamentous hemagglutinin
VNYALGPIWLTDLQIRIREAPANQRLQRRMRALEAQLLEIRARDTRMRQQMGGDRPYDPVGIREELKRRYGDDNVTSTTVPPTSKPNVRMRGGHIDATLPDGSTVRIVFDQRGFPIFDDVVRLEIHLENSTFRGASYDGQLRMATRDLRARIQRGEISASGFTEAQMTAIRSGAEKIPGYTWHHHQDTGRMQLVPEAIHSAVRHTGWESISSGV